MQPGKLSHEVKPNIPIVRNPSTNETNKQHQEMVATKRVRQCSKAQPLPPIHTGSRKSRKKNISRFKTTKKEISNKYQEERTNREEAKENSENVEKKMGKEECIKILKQKS